MNSSVEHILLRFYLGEDKRLHDKPVYETLVINARETNLAGATVFRLKPVVVAELLELALERFDFG